MKNFKQFLNENIDLAKAAKDIDSGRLSKDEKIKKVKELYPQIENMLNQKTKELVSIMKSVGNKYKNVKYKYRAKSLDSIISKVVHRGKRLESVSDLVAGMIITQSHKDSQGVVKDFLRKHGNIVTNTDEKKLGDNPSGYHGAFHLDLNLNGIQGEVQILHDKLEKKKAMAHDIYSATRDSASGPSKQDLQTSRMLFKRGMKEESEETIDLILEALTDLEEFLNSDI